MDPAAYATLPTRISSPRLAPYVAHCQGNTAEAVRLYTWNVEVSGAFWGVVHAFEVAMRNAIHEQMTQRYGRDDWWDDPQVPLHAVMIDQRDSAKTSGTKAAKKNLRPVTADDVVAALSFGFWSALLANGKQQFETRFWQPFLHQAFPGYQGPRSYLHSNVDSVRLFRNRLAHHEPVFARHLAADHASILRLAGYIDPGYEQYIADHSRVLDTLARRANAVGNGQATSF